jgi:hypothetical protein
VKLGMFQINQMDVVSLYGGLPITFTVYDVVFVLRRVQLQGRSIVYVAADRPNTR